LSGRFTEEEKSVLEARAERYRQSRESGMGQRLLAHFEGKLRLFGRPG
jgi:hypothetical protein